MSRRLSLRLELSLAKLSQMRSDNSPMKDTTCDRRKIIPQPQKEVSHQTQLIDGKRSFLVFEKAIEFVLVWSKRLCITQEKGHILDT